MRGGKKPGPVAVVVADHPSPAEGIYKAISNTTIKKLCACKNLVFFKSACILRTRAIERV